MWKIQLNTDTPEGEVIPCKARFYMHILNCLDQAMKRI